MQNLNRNIAGLNTIYEIQLKSISSQLESIDRVNRGLKDIRDMYDKAANESSRYCEETEKMARYMKQLNSVYEKMITAMTINMANPMMACRCGSGGESFRGVGQQSERLIPARREYRPGICLMANQGWQNNTTFTLQHSTLANGRCWK